MSNLVKVDFHGDVIEGVVDDDGTPWISIRRVCEALGVDTAAQLEKLKGEDEWATIGLIPMVADDGKMRPQSCLSLDHLPMWLATIKASKVAPEARPKLAIYKRECARVLYEHFFGRRQLAQVAPPSIEEIVARTVAATVTALAPAIASTLAAALAPIQDQIATIAPLKNKILMLEAANIAPGVIGAEGAQSICRRLVGIAQTRAFEGSGLSFKSEWGRLHAALRRHVNFHGTGGGGAWSMLPARRMVDANQWLHDAEVEAERVRKASGVEDKQLTIGNVLKFVKPAG